jgi:Flp pilus assembly protein TadD
LRRSRVAAYLAARCPGKSFREINLQMGIWKKLFGDETADRVDYYREGVELQNVGKFHEALTSFRLALREAPNDAAVLQQIAITYTRIGMTEEAVKTYRTVLATHPQESGAHYGLAFLLLRHGHVHDAERHLRAFLETPPNGADALRHIEHARSTLDELERGVVPEPEV